MSTETKWTPGPWEHGCLGSDNKHCQCGHIFSDGYAGSIATVSVHNGIPLITDGSNDCPVREEAIANMHLIAEAPELYKALEAMLHRYVRLVESGDAGNWNAEEDPEVIAARAALKKARGE